MYYKVSNTAERGEIEKKFGFTFKYPELYKPRMIINGLGEDNLDLVTMDRPDIVQPGIWGLLPHNFNEHWTTFQNVLNTLNLSLGTIANTKWIQHSLKYGRCLIIITGFFSYYLRKGSIYPYYISLETEEPFMLGGLCSVLPDGFISSGIITTDLKAPVSRYHNASHKMPLGIPESIVDEWMSPDFGTKHIENIIKNPPQMKFRANPIAKEFFKKNIVYESMLQPVYYEDIAEERTKSDFSSQE